MVALATLIPERKYEPQQQSRRVNIGVSQLFCSVLCYARSPSIIKTAILNLSFSEACSSFRKLEKLSPSRSGEPKASQLQRFD